MDIISFTSLNWSPVYAQCNYHRPCLADRGCSTLLPTPTTRFLSSIRCHQKIKSCHLLDKNPAQLFCSWIEKKTYQYCADHEALKTCTLKTFCWLFMGKPVNILRYSTTEFVVAHCFSVQGLPEKHILINYFSQVD